MPERAGCSLGLAVQSRMDRSIDFRGRPVLPVVPYASSGGPIEQSLLEALEAGDPSAVSRLLDAGANPNIQVDGKLGSLLHVACEVSEGDAALVTASLLLDRRADCEARRNDGATPLFVACARGHEPLSDLLLSRGPAVAHMLREDGSSPVFAAARAGHAECVQLCACAPAHALAAAPALAAAVRRAAPSDRRLTPDTTPPQAADGRRLRQPAAARRRDAAADRSHLEPAAGATSLDLASISPRSA